MIHVSAYSLPNEIDKFDVANAVEPVQPFQSTNVEVVRLTAVHKCHQSVRKFVRTEQADMVDGQWRLITLFPPIRIIVIRPQIIIDINISHRKINILQPKASYFKTTAKTDT